MCVSMRSGFDVFADRHRRQSLRLTSLLLLGVMDDLNLQTTVLVLRRRSVVLVPSTWSGLGLQLAAAARVDV